MSSINKIAVKQSDGLVEIQNIGASAENVTNCPDILTGKNGSLRQALTNVNEIVKNIKRERPLRIEPLFSKTTGYRVKYTKDSIPNGEYVIFTFKDPNNYYYSIISDGGIYSTVQHRAYASYEYYNSGDGVEGLYIERMYIQAQIMEVTANNRINDSAIGLTNSDEGSYAPFFGVNASQIQVTKNLNNPDKINIGFSQNSAITPFWEWGHTGTVSELVQVDMLVPISQ